MDMADQEKRNVEVRVAVLILKGDRILLEKRAHTLGGGTWAPPVGHLDFGEYPEQTAMRETQEETGIVIADPKFRVLTNDIFEEEQVHTFTIWMEAKYVSGEPQVKAPEEESSVEWFTWDGLPEPLFLPMRHLLEGKTYPAQTTEVKLEQVMEKLAASQKAQHTPEMQHTTETATP